MREILQTIKNKNIGLPVGLHRLENIKILIKTSYFNVAKITVLLILFNFIFTSYNYAQTTLIDNKQEKEIHSLIEKYNRARETSDTILLKSILTSDVDQLVSSGEWRMGIEGAMKGMMRSSASNPGDRTIKIEKIRFLNSHSAIVDARYEIQNTDGTSRKMWSTFIVVQNDKIWKIAAIRNMLPAG